MNILILFNKVTFQFLIFGYYERLGINCLGLWLTHRCSLRKFYSKLKLFIVHKAHGMLLHHTYQGKLTIARSPFKKSSL